MIKNKLSVWSGNKIIKKAMSFALLLTIISCKPVIRTKNDLIKYISDPANGLRQEKQINNITISCLYQPVALHQKKINTKIEDKKTSDRACFVLSLAKDNKELLNQLNYNLYSEMVQVLSFRMPQYVSLIIEGKEPIVPLDVFFQQTYGLSNSNNVLLIFDKAQIANTDEFKIKIKEFGLDLGNLAFGYKSKDLLFTDKIIN